MPRKKKKSTEETPVIQRWSSPKRPEMGLPLKYLAISGENEMKSSRSMNGMLEDLSMSGLVFKTELMRVDDIHLSYDETPLVRNKLTLEIDLPGGQKLTAIGEVSWYERSLVAKDQLYHVGVTFKELSSEDREALKEYLVANKKAIEAIALDV